MYNDKLSVQANALLFKVFTLFPALALLMSVKGGFVGMSWQRPCKVKVAFKSLNLVKRVSCVGRVGLNHENRQAVQDARASGELPAVNQGLPWGEWLIAPYFITHNGGLYVRLYPVEGSTPKASFHLDGKEVSKESIAAYLLASEFNEVNESIGCMTLKAESLTQVRYGENVVDVALVSEGFPSFPVKSEKPMHSEAHLLNLSRLGASHLL